MIILIIFKCRINHPFPVAFFILLFHDVTEHFPVKSIKTSWLIQYVFSARTQVKLQISANMNSAVRSSALIKQLLLGKKVLNMK